MEHVEHFTETNKLSNVASCWLYLNINHVYTWYACVPFLNEFLYDSLIMVV